MIYGIGCCIEVQLRNTL